MEKEIFAPIVFFVYNRLEHSKKTIEALKMNPESKDSVLYIFSDGPKANASIEDINKINKIREYIRTIDGFKKVYIEEAPLNKGLAKSTIEGITKIVNQYERVIVLEDDDAPSPYFLAYENECLDKFKYDDRYWLVSGYVNNRIVSPLESGDVYAVYRNSSWGFGTWARCWNKVIWDIDELKRMFNYRTFRDFARAGGFDLSVVMLGLFYGHFNSWSVRFEFSRFLHKGLTIFPSYSLIRNIGQDGTGTHSQSTEDTEVIYMQHPVQIHSVISFDEVRDKQLKDSFTPHNFYGYLFKHGLFFEPKIVLFCMGIYEPLRKVVKLFKK